MIIVKYYLYIASRKEEDFYLDALLAILTNKIKIEKNKSSHKLICKKARIAYDVPHKNVMLRLQKETGTQFNIMRNSKLKNSTKPYNGRVENEITVKLMSNDVRPFAICFLLSKTWMVCQYELRENLVCTEVSALDKTCMLYNLKRDAKLF